MKNIFLFLAVFQFAFISNAQSWLSSTGIEDKVVRTIISYSSDTLLAGVENSGIYISYDKGSSWTQFALDGETIYSLIKVDNSILAGTYGNDIYKATSIDSQWNHISINNLVFETIKYYDDTLYACTWMKNGGVYTSSDNGNTWSKYGDNSSNTILNIDFSPSGRRYVVTPFGMYYSDYQSGWVKTTGYGDTTRDVDYLGNDSVLYCSDEGIYISTDNGVSVQKFGEFYGADAFFKIDEKYYISGNGDLYYTSNINSTWLSTDLGNSPLVLIKHESNFIAGTLSGIYIKSVVSGVAEKNSKSENIKVFPNPTKELFQLENINSDCFTIKILNMHGQIVRISNSSTINISKLSNGLYLYNVIIDNETYSGKFFKE